MRSKRVRLPLWLLPGLLAGAAINLLSGTVIALQGLPELQPLDCSQEQSIRSTDGSAPTTIQFVNSTAAAVNVYWIDYTGQRVLYGVLNAGASYIQPTFVTHPWVITNLNDQCIVMFLPMASAARATIRDTRPSADLSIRITGSPDPVSSGGRITYTITIDNVGPESAGDVVVTDTLPPGVTFSSAASAQGSLTTPPAGGAGTITASIGLLPPGSSVSVFATVNVLAPAGSSVVNRATVTTSAADPNQVNNSAQAVTSVKGGAIVQLVWDQPPPTLADPTPAPINLRVQVGITPPLIFVARVEMSSPAATCTLIAVNIYKSESQPVQTIPDNLWKSVPPDQLDTTMAAAPGGSFFVITNLWKCDETIVESGGSNQASVPAGPVLEKLKVGAKLKITGSGFSAPAQVFLDGIGFVKQAVLAEITLVVQKGPLKDGRFLADVVRPGKTMIISVRNSNGGIASVAFTPP
ncbi:MAG: hypothetical protein WAV20_20365 [Blastocatellia bacterium]